MPLTMNPDFFLFLILVAVYIKKYVWVTIIFLMCMIVVSFGWKGGSSSEVTLSGFRDSYSNPTESKRHLVNASTDIKGTQTWIVFLFF